MFAQRLSDKQNSFRLDLGRRTNEFYQKLLNKASHEDAHNEAASLQLDCDGDVQIMIIKLNGGA